MDMSGAIRVSAHYLEQLSRGAGGVNSVLGRLQAVEPVLAVLIGTELAPKVVAALVLGVEGIVLAVGAGLPHVEDGIRDALAGVSVLDDTVEKCELPVFGHVLDYAGAKLPERGVGGPERSEDGGRCSRAAFLQMFSDDCVVDLVDETRKTLLANHGIIFIKAMMLILKPVVIVGDI
jgi:hypothetical protein